MLFWELIRYGKVINNLLFQHEFAGEMRVDVARLRSVGGVSRPYRNNFAFLQSIPILTVKLSKDKIIVSSN